MLIRELHPWNLTPRQAIDVQKRLRRSVETEDRLGEIRHVAGVDVGFDRTRRMSRAAVAVLEWPSLNLADKAQAELEVSFPYVPGLLSFREIPVVLKALERLEIEPDLIICDGHGVAHPRRCGLACHLGLVTDMPSLGVAKSRLVGSHDPLAPERGSSVGLVDKGEVVGRVLRTRVRVKPVFVSVGHRVSLETSVDLTLRATPRYRLPETTRQAHRLASG